MTIHSKSPITHTMKTKHLPALIQCLQAGSMQVDVKHKYGGLQFVSMQHKYDVQELFSLLSPFQAKTSILILNSHKGKSRALWMIDILVEKRDYKFSKKNKIP